MNGKNSGIVVTQPGTKLKMTVPPIFNPLGPLGMRPREPMPVIVASRPGLMSRQAVDWKNRHSQHVRDKESGVVYQNAAEASWATGLAPNSIRTQCSPSGSSGRRTRFEWTDAPVTALREDEVA